MSWSAQSHPPIMELILLKVHELLEPLLSLYENGPSLTSSPSTGEGGVGRGGEGRGGGDFHPSLCPAREWQLVHISLCPPASLLVHMDPDRETMGFFG